MLNFKIDAGFEILLKNNLNFPRETGGMIFGKKGFFGYRIITLSQKSGETLSVNFNRYDRKIFCLPYSLTMIGTWHFHPFHLSRNPSYVDIDQYLKWGKWFIHIICNNEGYSIYNYRGVKIYDKNY